MFADPEALEAEALPLLTEPPSLPLLTESPLLTLPVESDSTDGVGSDLTD